MTAYIFPWEVIIYSANLLSNFAAPAALTFGAQHPLDGKMNQRSRMPRINSFNNIAIIKV